MILLQPVKKALRALAAATKATGLLVLLLPTASGAEPYAWQTLADLPEPLGVAGPFVGTSNGALVVAGGAHFPVSPFQGGTKVWIDSIYVLDDPESQWRQAGRLDRPLAYGGSVTTPEGIVLLGGSDSSRHYADVIRLRVVDGSIEKEELPDLPRACANIGVALLGNAIYVAGGQGDPGSRSALRNFWRLDLSREPLQWEPLEPWRGPPRMLPVVATQDGALYVISGAELLADDAGGVTRRFLTDVWRYSPESGVWNPVAEAPRAMVAAPAIAEGQSHILVFGGDDGHDFLRQAELGDDHPGFTRRALAYHTITDTWADLGATPFGHVTTTAVRWRGQVIVASGEDRPGHRSSRVYSGAPPPKSHLTAVDTVTMALYLLSLVIMGIYLSRRGKSTEDFFLAGRRIPWWAAGLSIFGTQLSAITFMTIPAKAYATDWVFFMANVAIVAIAPIVIVFYLPFFQRLRVTTVYEYLELRFNVQVRLFASLAFILFQLGRMTIVLFLPALALSTVTGMNVYMCILVMGVLCTFYTVLGGIEAVIWTDVLQVIVLLGGGLLCLALILHDVGGLGEVVQTGAADGKFHMIDWSWDMTTTSVWIVLFGSMFANLGVYTSDQSVVQRYLTTKDEKAAARSLWTNVAVGMPGTVLWFGLGTCLYVFYKQRPGDLDPGVSTDAILPLFIAKELPSGVSGAIIAAVFAATMSSLDSSLHSISTVVVTDFYRRFRQAATDLDCLRLAKRVTAVLGLAATVTALLLATYDFGSLWDVFLEVMSLFGGALGGLFALGIFTKRATGPGALVGALTSAVVLYLVRTYTPLHFLTYAAVGASVCLLVGYAASLVLPGRPKDLTGLTVYTNS